MNSCKYCKVTEIPYNEVGCQYCLEVFDDDDRLRNKMARIHPELNKLDLLWYGVMSK